jgi:hypothetical protein
MGAGNLQLLNVKAVLPNNKTFFYCFFQQFMARYGAGKLNKPFDKYSFCQEIYIIL